MAFNRECLFKAACVLCDILICRGRFEGGQMVLSTCQKNNKTSSVVKVISYFSQTSDNLSGFAAGLDLVEESAAMLASLEPSVIL